eukprot:1120508-Pleurochrysis_carterae.AAC.3
MQDRLLYPTEQAPDYNVRQIDWCVRKSFHPRRGLIGATLDKDNIDQPLPAQKGLQDPAGPAA